MRKTRKPGQFGTLPLTAPKGTEDRKLIMGTEGRPHAGLAAGLQAWQPLGKPRADRKYN